MSSTRRHTAQCNGAAAARRLRKPVTKLVCIVTLIASTTVPADDQDVIDYRQHVMKTMGAQSEIIGMILQHKAPADDFATHVQILAITAATAKMAFEPKVPGGDAKPEVWAQWPDFAKRLDTLAAAAENLARIAKDGGIPAAAAKVEAALSCKGCHDNYRVPRK